MPKSKYQRFFLVYKCKQSIAVIAAWKTIPGTDDAGIYWMPNINDSKYKEKKKKWAKSIK